MKCISDELIQKYIDWETSDQENTSIQNHVSSCSHCLNKIESQKKMADNLKKALNNMGQGHGEIPEFKAPANAPKKIHINLKRIVYIVSAACILLFTIFITQKRSETTKKEVILIYNLEGEYDANRTPSNQELIINIIDPDGNVSEFMIDD